MKYSESHSHDVDLVMKTSYSLSSALYNESKLDMTLFNTSRLCGFSGMSFRNFMNNIGTIENLNYLEVGTYCGSTLLSLMYKNLDSINCVYTIDNWVEFNEKGVHSRDVFYRNLDFFFKERPRQLKVIEEDCFSLDLDQIKEKINFYFYDGPHSKQDHYNAYMYYDKVLADTFITVIDDWNEEKVKTGTLEAFKDLNYNVIASWEILTDDKKDWKDNPDPNWWTGVYIAIIKKRRE